ncbi:MAG: carboxy terminal-processing peptidase [Gammaproteobacteria bacterium]|nr:MAG: carboxy terminal-processing peptidase [Gammaproteobacteria bacterium]
MSEIPGPGFGRALLILFQLLVILAVPAASGPARATAEPERSAIPEPLESTARQQQVARMTTRFVERFHYSRQDIDDQMSEQILKNFIEALDGNRQYFLEPDIVYFSRYRHALDEVLDAGNVEPVFDIFRLYRLRAQQNLTYALSQLTEEPDFKVDEDFVFDREKAPWLATPRDMQENWRKRVKNDALGLLLADKTWPEAADILRKRYERVLKRINELDSDEVFETFMNAFARTLDPHSSYLSPRQSEEYRIQMSLSYQGIGASLQLDDEVVKVLNVIPGGPAAIDGRLKANDRITAVGQGADGELVDVVGWELDDVVQLIRGPQGTLVRLQVLPAGALPGASEQVLNLTRDKVKLEEQAAKGEVREIRRDDRIVKVGVITVPSFYQDYDARNNGDENYISTTRDVRRLLGELTKQGIEGLVMDLRGNGGGHLSEATSLTGLFIDTGPIVQLRDTSGRVEVLADPEPSVAYSGPLVVLVDRFSASASEIFTAAIQDYHRGIVIGQQTFGKGTVQNLYPLDQYTRRSPEPGLGQLTLTIGKYYRVTGGSTQNRGVMPDINLPSGVDPAEVGENIREGALPWDQIDATRYRASGPLDASIAYLTQHETERMQEDPDVRYLLSGIEAANHARETTSVSLNMEKRLAEREQQRKEQLDRENVRRRAQGLAALGSLDEINPDERPDVLLNQATQILTDFVALDRTAKAAANTPEPEAQ